MKAAIIIPARYGSTRFPGKPLVKLGGESMLSRVVNVAKEAGKSLKNVTLAVATEDRRIEDHCKEIGIHCVMTSDSCKTGSDRVLEAAQHMGGDFDFVALSTADWISPRVKGASDGTWTVLLLGISLLYWL